MNKISIGMHFSTVSSSLEVRSCCRDGSRQLAPIPKQKAAARRGNTLWAEKAGEKSTQSTATRPVSLPECERAMALVTGEEQIPSKWLPRPAKYLSHRC